LRSVSDAARRWTRRTRDELETLSRRRASRRARERLVCDLFPVGPFAKIFPFRSTRIASTSASIHYPSPVPNFSPRRRSGLSSFRYDGLFSGGRRTFSRFHHGLVATYAFEVGAPGRSI
jgi:hypothetical protein